MKIKSALLFGLINLILFTLSIDTYGQKKKGEPMDQLVTISTSFGNIKILLYDDTPNHKQNFLSLVNQGFYNRTVFHRIINGFMIQCGEDTSASTQIKTFEENTIPSEILPNRVHKRGAVSMARTENPGKRSDRTQFFIVQSYTGSHFLDNNYTVFGEVVSGFEVIDKIAAQEKDINDRPIIPIRMTIKSELVKRSDVIRFYSYIYE